MTQPVIATARLSKDYGSARGIYDLVVTATDIRGNSSNRSLRFTVHNRPGWVGS